MSSFAPEIKYSNRRRTIGLTVERDRQLVVHVPAGTSDDTIQAILHQKRHWIQEKLDHPQKYPVAPTTPVMRPGSSIYFLGRTHLLQTAPELAAPLYFDGHTFTLGAALMPKASALVQTWLRRQAQTVMLPRVERFAKSLGVSYQRIQLLDLKYRWGSCTANAALLFNWRLIQSPSTVIDYIIVHELAHLLINDHSPAFWNVVAVQLPLYERAKTWLREHGAILEELG
ncbi:MAG TPA: SprT family zinc-dependent metalloprotease [Hymenobacter sp.]|uniref:M48 family metallopeptidase n=1 Tax=Hymenobacter sp. TaxID=1898978 RepID=UPI002D7EE9D3|nr:SprT family zinc-dependent metalloprotease [Hymenobacter sp.]HET9504899.1 SprT family zinc-dependent metalloprotease [Hymenobacter sp.]